MLLVHQAGGLQVGQTARYTLTYTPSADRILPSPTHLYLKIKNNSPLPLRAAYLHGPYSLYVAAYPSTFNPNQQANDPSTHGVPEFEPYLKAGANWTCKLTVPDDIRESGADFAMSRTRAAPEKAKKSVTWIIEIVSQVIFSNSATVQFEMLVGRDERGLELGFAAVAAHGHGGPGQLAEHKKSGKGREGRSDIKGVFSRAVKLKIEDTEDLWNKPRLPGSRNKTKNGKAGPGDEDKGTDEKPKKKQKIHLVILTHGLHSNLNADLLYMKESIDATVAQAREERRARRAKQNGRDQSGQHEQRAADGDRATNSTSDETAATAALSGGQEEIEDEADEEQVIVRGFSGNAIRTERGIQFLGKRLAKYVLHLTYPSQPFLPVKRTVGQSISSKFGMADKKPAEDLPAQHQGSTIHHDPHKQNDKAYQFTSISFVGHSLGGLTQLYAIAYIQKHAPDFFNLIQPVSFICMASPLLGLSNENPMYVKFALDFGLVGRTGQDLGLTWRAPTLARSGWSALGGVFGTENKDQQERDPGAKPLLRILPTGPAHRVLHQFRNRTLYSNVVNDGIVPLRTSCLLFLDWKGLGKVQKYRRENGVLGTMAEWGWAELTGANAERDMSLSPANQSREWGNQSEESSPTLHGPSEETLVPQPSETATADDNKNSAGLSAAASHLLPSQKSQNHNPKHEASTEANTEPTPLSSGSTSSVFDGFLNMFRPNNNGSPKSPASAKKTPKAVRALQRAQTLSQAQEDASSNADGESPQTSRPSTLSQGTTESPTMRQDKSRPTASRLDTQDNLEDDLAPPPKTSIFESASDLLHPPVPSTQWIIDPASRPRTIFHDRVYHPSDIPPPPMRRPSRATRTTSSDLIGSAENGSSPTLKHQASQQSLGSEVGMKVEERIARAYHRDLSWRKVLVKLEPDAHNNMVVRRMFANAYGWPVVKHLCDTHFGDTYAAQTRDEDESGTDRAAVDVPIVEDGDDQPTFRPKPHKEKGEEVQGQTDKTPPPVRRDSELREIRDELTSLHRATTESSLLESSHHSGHPGAVPRRDTDSAAWDDHFFSASDDDDDDEDAQIYRAGPTGTATPPPRKQSLGSRVLRASDGRLHVRTMHSFSSMVGGGGGGGGSSSARSGRRPSRTTPDVVLKADPFDGTLTAEPEAMDWTADSTTKGSAVASPADERRFDVDGSGQVTSQAGNAGTTGLGLERDVHEAMTAGIPGDDASGGSAGVSERVAGASGSAARKRDTVFYDAFG